MPNKSHLVTTTEESSLCAFTGKYYSTVNNLLSFEALTVDPELMAHIQTVVTLQGALTARPFITVKSVTGYKGTTPYTTKYTVYDKDYHDDYELIVESAEIRLVHLRTGRVWFDIFGAFCDLDGACLAAQDTTKKEP